MSSIRFFLFVTFLATIAFASPQSRSFSVPRQLNPNHPGPNGALAMAKIFNKYSLMPGTKFKMVGGLIGNISTNNAATASASNTSSSATSTNSGGAGNRSSTGEVVARPGDANAALFLSPVDIGGQTVMLDFDSGSSDLWTFSTALSKEVIGQHRAFDPKKSKTFALSKDQTWKILYGDGSGASGVVGTDVVTVGGVRIAQQTVELATNVSASFQMDEKTDGLLGLAFSKLNTVKTGSQPTPQKTFLDNALPSLDLPVFVADLAPDGTGVYDFGKIDQTKFVGKMAWTPVNASSGFWQFSSTKFAVGAKNFSNPQASPAIADTGTSLMIVDQMVAEKYYAEVKGAVLDPRQGGFVYPCASKLPDLSVAAGDNMIRIPGSVVQFATVDPPRNTTCFGGIQGNMGSGMQIYGDIMFRAQLVAFNSSKPSLGFGQKRV